MKPGLIEPLGHLAAEELLHDLRAQDELRRFVLPDVWLEDEQLSAIDALSHSEGICVAVGLAEDRLPHSGDEKQGGLIHLGLAVYVFQAMDGVPVFSTRDVERVWLTVLHYAMRWSWQPPREARAIKAQLRDISTVDLRQDVEGFAAKLVANVLRLEVPARV